ncbi:hypothetical protein PF005_g24942 [Phytophthora fragariae]|uniref:Uncharacterized protein n=1 Tax=Phytophthora fragariae TaxID=53985 RepID=A0A6A3W0C3_9STRA|nr:hypothetical protein PF003_g37404 [Phytophthora fragariae]KAE8924474.1 hypothetical protein PF009_g25295 [Phytophthora fragariae]KAE9078646.1 hypothetical protein PF007_g23769 [Phytophthora fragariae]KAE9092727.1 hypothetical protein PF006_g24619 [Phytophthora fragariae]KAE9173774.1 hypothetical protein PF004_g26862 [Phytophthora fragariae]
MGCFAATRRARAFCLVNVGHTILAGANPRSAAVRASSLQLSPCDPHNETIYTLTSSGKGSRTQISFNDGFGLGVYLPRFAGFWSGK